MALVAGARRPRKPSHKRRRLKKLIYLRLAWLLLWLAHLYQQPSQLASATPTTTSVRFYAQLPKPLGLVAGLQVNPQTAAFLGLSYAAPPLASLRLMPPGASRSPAPPISGRPFRLLPANQQTSQVREATKFGPRCVHLADWLPDAPESGARQSQSEDCLNANLFVPLKVEQTSEPEEQQMSQQQRHDRVMSNYASNQQGKNAIIA